MSVDLGSPAVTTLTRSAVDGDRRHDWLLQAVARRLREEFAKLDLRLNEAKSRIVDLARGEVFGFLGFDFRRARSLRGATRSASVETTAPPRPPVPRFPEHPPGGGFSAPRAPRPCGLERNGDSRLPASLHGTSCYGALQTILPFLPSKRRFGVREGNTLAFKGIPSAKPPVGSLRWRPPEEGVRWEGTRRPPTRA